VTTSQLRNIFSEVRRVEQKLETEDWQTDFLMLRPKIAYSTARVLARTKQSTIKDFREIIELAHAQVQGKKENFDNFVKFFEGIIAYHKVYGGKD
jgi:CRISPR-associated protein Csm2